MMLLAALLTISSAFLSVNGFRVVCYVQAWAHWRAGSIKFIPAKIDTTRCTHVVYYLAELDTTSLTIIPHDSGDPDMYSQLAALKTQHPNITNLIAVGGWNLGVEKWDTIVSSEDNINTFATNAVQFLRTNNFDGVVIDWEYPGDRGSPAADKQKYTQLLTALKAAFVKDAADTGKPRLLLTALISPSQYRVQMSYELAELIKLVDYFDLSTYGLHGYWETTTGHPSALYSPSGGQDAIDPQIQFILSNSVPAGMLNLGISTSGTSYTLADPTSTDVVAAATGAGAAGSLMKQEGVLAYFEICKILQAGGATNGTLTGSKAPYIIENGRWTGYDDVASVQEKVDYAVAKGLGGIMLYTIDLDDFNDICGDGKYPLLTAATDRVPVVG
ncbi:chitotriosidase-1-like [Pomacea canaliculata]|nr:chitotriosidase-1-like [Pomacea canaliculata]